MVISQSERCTVSDIPHHLMADTGEATDINKGRHSSENLIPAKISVHV